MRMMFCAVRDAISRSLSYPRRDFACSTYKGLSDHGKIWCFILHQLTTYPFFHRHSHSFSGQGFVPLVIQSLQLLIRINTFSYHQQSICSSRSSLLHLPRPQRSQHIRLLLQRSAMLMHHLPRLHHRHHLPHHPTPVRTRTMTARAKGLAITCLGPTTDLTPMAAMAPKT
jgi:hypothetical protein